MTAPAPTPYDVCGPLPTGTTLLEASAGTGKTFTIAALATRLVAEGAAELSELLLVTFSRAATAELRDRVRERFVLTYRKLADPAAARADGDDSVVSFLADVTDAEVALRRRRLGHALSVFDAATIATTHGFCQQMLAGLGMAAGTNAAATLLERLDDLVTEVVDDLYVRKYARNGGGGVPLLDYGCARGVAGTAVADPFSRLEPTDAEEGTEAQHRYGMAHAARVHVERRKRARHLFTYDDLLIRLHAALTDADTGPAACERLRSRYRYVLVDEFQDTDPVQWEILRTPFLGRTTLVLIGDPKQAIYAFRGADVFAYLRAADEATTHHTLSRNWRSDADLLACLHHVYGDAALGDTRIVVRAVESAHPSRRLAGAPVDAPLRLRVVPRALFGEPTNKSLGVDPVRHKVSLDVAADIAALLASGATLTLNGVPRPVSAGDVAVLVRRHKDAASVRAALSKVGVPAVLTGAKSVFLTAPAREWLSFLRALEQPHRPGLVRAAALTPFVGWGAARLTAATDPEVDEFGLRLRGWRDVLAGRGVAALLEVVTDTQNLTERLLARIDGERHLTDLRHIGQALHAAARAQDLGATALVGWLRRQITDAEQEQTEEGSRRLESDADAVQIATIYVSKGLEFPIVYAPFGWDRNVDTKPDPATFHDDGGHRVLYVGGRSGPGYDDCKERHLAEDAGEALRLLYVALTRAQCQVVTWWAPTGQNTCGSALHRLLFGDRAPGEQPPQSVPVPDDTTVRERLTRWASAAGASVSVEQVGEPSAARWVPPGVTVPGLDAASFSRSLDGAWRRTSYSSLTAAASDAATHDAVDVASEPEIDERRDEPSVDGVGEAQTDPDEALLRAVPSPMADLPSGAAFGTLVHRVLETVDTATGDLAADLQARCAEVLRDRITTDLPAPELAAGLLPALQTPLGPLAFGRPLGTIAAGDRLTELEFEMPLLGGDQPRSATATLNAVADLMRRHLHAGDPLFGYADALADPLLGGQVLRGYLAGSIDAVLRLRDDAGSPRYLVVDYKTNWLGGFGPSGRLPLTAWDYRPAALAATMANAHYPLQALIYSVALHRYLRWRQPAYDPAVHLGGVLYLFLRGMCGASTPVVDGAPTGVFSWRPHEGLVDDLSGLIDQGVP